MTLDLVKHISVAGDEALKMVKDRREGKVKSLITPWPKLNRYLLDGFEFGGFAILGGMSGSSKTLAAAQLMKELHKLNPLEEFIILFFSFEMSASKILMRNIIAETQINRDTVLSAKGQTLENVQLQQIERYIGEMKGKEVYFIEKSVSPEEYIKICREMYKKYGKKIVAISDHSLLFEGENEDNDRGMLSRLSKQIITLKNEGWSMHILLSQLNREIEKAERRVIYSPLNYPDQSCLFASSALYQAADYVIFIHRPYLLKFIGNSYGPDKLPTTISSCYFHLAKQREGETAILQMEADLKGMRIIGD